MARDSVYPARIVLLAALCAVLAAPAARPAAAQDAADPFDTSAFDSGIEASLAPGGSATASFLAGGTVLVRSSATATLEGGAGSASASARLFAKASLPDYGSFYVAYNLGQAFFAGLAGTGAEALAPPRDLFSPSFSLSEFHWSFDLGKVLFVRLGNQLVSWGPSRIWSPVDFINLEKADAFQGVDLRTGKPGLRLHLPLPGANAFLFADFSRGVVAGVVQDPLESLALGARLDGTIGEAELGLTLWTGATVQDRLGLDFSGRLLGFSFYGETAWAPAFDEGGESLAASLGLSRAVGDLRRVTLSAELSYDSRGEDYTGDTATMLTLTPLYMGRYYAYASAQAREFLAPPLTTTVSALANLSDLSWQLKLAESFAFPDSPPWTLSLAWNGGGPGREFTLAAGGDSLSLSFELRAEF